MQGAASGEIELPEPLTEGALTALGISCGMAVKDARDPVGKTYNGGNPEYPKIPMGSWLAELARLSPSRARNGGSLESSGRHGSWPLHVGSRGEFKG